jgi:hypothetical protein
MAEVFSIGLAFEENTLDMIIFRFLAKASSRLRLEQRIAIIKT